MRYTTSKDGKERATIHASARLTREELADLRKKAKRDEVTLRVFLDRCFRDGLYNAELNDEE